MRWRLHGERGAALFCALTLALSAQAEFPVSGIANRRISCQTQSLNPLMEISVPVPPPVALVPPPEIVAPSLFAPGAATVAGAGGAHRAYALLAAPGAPLVNVKRPVPKPPLHLGGQPIESLDCLGGACRVGTAEQPQMLGMDIIPGKGMNVFQLRAQLPGKGKVNLFASPDLHEFKQAFESAKDPWENSLFSTGGAILLPYANRVRGRYLPEANLIETDIGGRTVRLPANWQSNRADGEKLSMHGLAFNRPFEIIQREIGPDHVSLTGRFNAGDFGGQWPSKTTVIQKSEMKGNKFTLTITATNTGNEPAPMGIGWHPYFAIPSGQREQARLVVSAQKRALVDNYEDMRATGQLEDVAGTPYDFRVPEGKALGNMSLDDSFVDLVQSPNAYVELVDPAANYGLRVKALSPDIKTFQVFAPAGKNFVAIEPQFNFVDPFGAAWKGKAVDTGMKTLQPGEAVTYKVELEIFTPQKNDHDRVPRRAPFEFAPGLLEPSHAPIGKH